MEINITKAKYVDNYKIQYRDLIWNDYEMGFPIWDLYNGKI